MATSVPTSASAIICVLAIGILCKVDSYTNWRYGDGQLHNSLSSTQRLFSNGKLSSQASMESSLSFTDVNTNRTLNTSNKILYPLVTESNELFVFRLGGAHCVTKYVDPYGPGMFPYSVQNCDLQIIKLDAELVAVWNETLYSNLTCYTLQDHVPCINYPIYHTYNDTSYVVVSFNNLNYSEYPQTNKNYSNFLQILNVTQPSIFSANSSAVIVNVTYNSFAEFVFQVYPNQPVVQQDCVYYHYFSTIQYASYDMTHMVIRLSDGEQLWSSTVRNLTQFWDLNGLLSWNYQLYRPAIGGGRVVMQQSNGLVAYNLSNGKQVWNAQSIRAHQASACNAVVHHAYQVLFGCLYDIFEHDIDADTTSTHLFAVALRDGAIMYSSEWSKNINFALPNALFLNEEQDELLFGTGSVYSMHPHGLGEMWRYRINYIGLELEYMSNSSLFLAHSYFIDESLLLLTQTLPLNIDPVSNPFQTKQLPKCYPNWTTTGNAFELAAAATSNCDMDSAANSLNDDVNYFYPAVGNDNGLIYLISEQYQVQAFRADHEDTDDSKRVALYVGIGVAAVCGLICIVALAMYCKKKKTQKHAERQPMLAADTKRSVNY